MTTEQWRPVLGYEGIYEVSEHGALRSLDRHVAGSHDSTRFIRGGAVSWWQHRAGYRLYRLWREHRSEVRTAHQLVLEAFLGPRAEGLEGCHGDGDPTNNHISNLRWDTPSGNAYDRVKHGTNRNAAKTTCKRGHPFDEANTIRINAQGHRRCRICTAATKNAWEQRQRSLRETHK